MGAAASGHTEIVRLLLHAKADLNIQTENGYTASMCAAASGHTEIVELLGVER